MEGLDFHLVYFWFVGDVAAPEIGLHHVGVNLVTI
jgi:hypothetical protein